MSGKNLVNNGFSSLGFSENLLCNNGLASPRKDFFGALVEAWILGSSVLPQPANKVGVWIDAENWADANVWYD